MERQTAYEDTEALDLRYYATLAWRYLWVLALVPVVLAGVAYFQADGQDRMYSATSQVLLRPNDPNERLGSSDQAVSQVGNIEQYVRSQGNLARSPEIRVAVAQQLDVTAKSLEKTIKVTALVDSNTLEITATTTDPEQSVEVANAVADEYITNRREYARAGLERAIADIDAKIEDVTAQLKALSASAATGTDSASATAEIDSANSQLSELTNRKYGLEIDVSLKNGEAEIIAEAEEPDGPVSPRPLRSAILGGMLGVLLAAGGVLLKDRFDTKLRSREEAEAVTGLTALGELPYDKLTEKNLTGVASIRQPDGPLAEAIRSLRVSLRFLSLETPIQVLLVTSPTPSDGKSTTSLNLAGSYAQAGQRTLLVSGDLRRPKAEKLIGSSPGPGLVDLLTEIAARREQGEPLSQRLSGAPTLDPATGGTSAAGARVAMRLAEQQRNAPAPLWITEWCHADEENLWVLPAGTPVANPVEILGSVATRDFFELAREQFDVVIIDSPPVMAVADPVVLSPYADGVVVLCAQRRTSRVALQRSAEVLGSSQARVLGLVVNLVPMKKGYYTGYYGNTRVDG